MGKLTKVTIDAEIKKIEAAPGAKPVKLSDGLGLYLLVRPHGAKSWKMKYRFDGTEKLLSFGAYPEVKLAAAREHCLDARELLRKDIDPAAQRKAARVQREATAAADKPFREIADEWIDDMVSKTVSINGRTWSLTREKRHVDRFEARFKQRPFRSIELREIIEVLKPYERAGKYETRFRMHSTINRICGFAKARGYITVNPVADIKFGEGFTSHLSARRPRPAIIDPEGFGALMRKIDSFATDLTGPALRLLALTWARPIELTYIKANQIDRDEAVWEIPIAVQKQRTQRARDNIPLAPHRVPLSRQALAIIDELLPYVKANGYLFPGRSGRPMSENTLNNALRSMGYADRHCAHGFRATARTLLGRERVRAEGALRRRFEKELLDMQLDHQSKKDQPNKDDPYDRDDRWSERVKLMQFWADRIDHLRKGGARVVELRPTA